MTDMVNIKIYRFGFGYVATTVVQSLAVIVRERELVAY